MDYYLDGAIEAEADAICDGENVYIIGIMEHIEPCGIHSGDSNATLPPFNLGEFVMQQIKDHTKNIALALQTVGLINIQFAIKDDIVYIIEANPRASRTGESILFIEDLKDDQFYDLYARRKMYLSK